MNANARDFDPSSVDGGYQQEQQSQQYQDPNSYGMAQEIPEGGGGYYDPVTGYQQDYSQTDYNNAGQWNETSQEDPVLVPGCYYPTIPNVLQPTLYNTPISALAYDDEYEAIYVASQTQPLKRTTRASMMVTHSTLDGMLYSSCAAHPEASKTTLETIYNMFYNGPISTSSKAVHTIHIPGHAYQPFGKDNTLVDSVGGIHSKYHLGVTTLMPLKGYVASVSPSAVRVHTHGGLCISDNDIEGMVAGTLHPGHAHVSVGGVAIGKHQSHVHCMDIYQNLRIVSSNTFRSDNDQMGVMCMATNHEKQTLVAGCSDGTLRLLDGSFRSRGRSSELAKVKSHAAGVSNVAVSYDGNLVCTTGFASRGGPYNAPYAFPDQHVLIYDVRYLGRGGILHSFSGVNGGPRLVSFIPDVPDLPSNRVLVASGQGMGGIQIITPFDTDGADFLVPQQMTHGETMTALHVSDQYLAIGTSQCNVFQYELAGYGQHQQTKRASSFADAPEFIPSGAGYGDGLAGSSSGVQPVTEKKPLELPSYIPEPPAMSMDPSLLQSSGDPGLRNGATDKLKSIFTAYVMCADPTTLNKDGQSAFSSFANDIILTAAKRNVSNQLLNASSKFDGDVMSSIRPTNIGIVDLFENESSGRGNGKEDEGVRNPNRLLHSEKLSAICYEKTEAQETRKGRDRRKRSNAPGRNDEFEDRDDGADDGIPKRYRQMLKPSHSKGASFSHAQYNETGIWPGWDYPPSMPNAYAPPVLLWLYFVPEIRSMMMARQFDRSGKPTATAVPPLSAELGCVFHGIDCLSNYARIYPDESMLAKVGAFVPANLLASFASMPEADALALLDGNPAAVERARRPEAFFRFLLHHLHKEVASKKGGSKIIDGLHGFTFVSVNEFITGSGPPVVSKQHSMMVDLSYDLFVNKSEKVRFGEVLRHALSKESRLRAWCEESRSYETVVQRKIVTSLPSILALSCCCAGNHNKDGLSIWRTNAPDNGHWLPEFIEVEIEANGNVKVRELADQDGSSDRVWMEFNGTSELPPAVADIVKSNLGASRKHRYRLDGVLSFVRDSAEDATSGEVKGHHVLHARIPSSYKRQAYSSQLEKAQMVASAEEASSDTLTLTSGIKQEVFQKRVQDAEERIKAVDQAETNDDWVLFNGFVVSSTVSEDARAFHVSFKDPCLVVFRAVDNDAGTKSKKERKNSDGGNKDSSKLGLSVMQTKSIYSGRKPEYNPHRSNMLPGAGDLIAFDAEFVSVQEEESELTDRGSKVTVRETRLALARMSVIDCASGTVIVDDYVVPSEPVVDYLTRFSGITAADLDPKTTPHHLVTMQSAYLKLRFLTERGCIFVGHGLSQDFLTVNLVVPPDQIIDTVEIFHQDRMRWISLRFLTNYVFRKDMQQDVHDSVEDARAAYALYRKAIELKGNGTFDKFLQDLYVYGAARDWKLGVDE